MYVMFLQSKAAQMFQVHAWIYFFRLSSVTISSTLLWREKTRGRTFVCVWDAEPVPVSTDPICCCR